MKTDILMQFAQALAGGAIRVIDLSQALDSDTAIIQLPPEFGRTWPFRLEEISRYDARGPAWYWNNFSCGEHTGTHFDAPVHWVTRQGLSGQRDRFHPGGEVHRAGLRDRRLAGGRGRCRFPADPAAGRGLGSRARAHRGRLLGADAHRLVQAPRRRRRST